MFAHWAYQQYMILQHVSLLSPFILFSLTLLGNVHLAGDVFTAWDIIARPEGRHFEALGCECFFFGFVRFGRVRVSVESLQAWRKTLLGLKARNLVSERVRDGGGNPVFGVLGGNSREGEGEDFWGTCGGPSIKSNKPDIFSKTFVAPLGSILCVVITMMMMMMTPYCQHTLQTAICVHKLNKTKSSSSIKETEKGFEFKVYHRVP